MELADLLKVAVERKASDLHIKVGTPPVLRIDHRLFALTEMPRLTQDTVVAMAATVMNARQRERFKEHNEADLAHSVPGLGRFRINIFQQRGMVGMVLRLIPLKVQTISELNLPPVLEKIAMEPRGLVLVTGTTGSGKSSTLAALIDYINTNRTGHIITIEDPIEFLHRDKRCLVSQREVGMDTMSFSEALRSALRQDPDIILVGEMRDFETISTAILAAETGHLVMSTLHTLDATETINRIISVFAPYQQKQIRLQLASVIKGVILAAADPSRRRERAGARGGGLRRHRHRAGLHLGPRQDAQAPGRHRGRGQPVRHADLRPVPNDTVHPRPHHIRGGAALVQQPRRFRAAGPRRGVHLGRDVARRGCRRAGEGHAGHDKVLIPACGGQPDGREKAPPERAPAWDEAVRWLALRARSTSEVGWRLRRLGYRPDEIAGVIGRLTASRYLDDAEFARSWVRSRAERAGYGPSRLRRELRDKGIDEAEIAGALAELTAERDVRDLAAEAARRRLPALRGLASAVARRRMAGYLSRRGFGAEVILELCRRLFPADADDPDPQ